MVAGAGLHFVVDADIIVAAEHAVFLDTHVNVGMVGAIENIGLAKRLPLGSALRMTLCGKKYRMPAQRAYELGLVDEVVPADKLLETGRRDRPPDRRQLADRGAAVDAVPVGQPRDAVHAVDGVRLGAAADALGPPRLQGGPDAPSPRSATPCGTRNRAKD